jgi:hypothetical protein
MRLRQLSRVAVCLLVPYIGIDIDERNEVEQDRGDLPDHHFILDRALERWVLRNLVPEFLRTTSLLRSHVSDSLG